MSTQTLFDELGFTDQMNSALTSATAVLRCVLLAAAADGEHGIADALGVVLDKMRTAEELFDEWDTKSRHPRADEARRLEVVARANLPEEPLDLKTIRHLEGIVNKWKAEQKAGGKKKTQRPQQLMHRRNRNRA